MGQKHTKEATHSQHTTYRERVLFSTSYLENPRSVHVQVIVYYTLTDNIYSVKNKRQLHATLMLCLFMKLKKQSAYLM